MPTDSYHGFLLNQQFHLANQMKLPSQVVKGRNGMQAVKAVNNDTIKCEIKQKRNGYCLSTCTQRYRHIMYLVYVMNIAIAIHTVYT